MANVPQSARDLRVKVTHFFTKKKDSAAMVGDTLDSGDSAFVVL